MSMEFIEGMPKEDRESFLTFLWDHYPDEYEDVWYDDIPGELLLKRFLRRHPEEFSDARSDWATLVTQLELGTKRYTAQATIGRREEVEIQRMRDEEHAEGLDKPISGL